MNKNTYIESGIIESYVLGLATHEEAAELESMTIQHAEIKQAVDDFAIQVEKYSLQDSTPPPPQIKDKIIAELQNDFDNKKASPVISFTPKEKASSQLLKLWQYVAAASVILFISSAALNFYLYNNFQSANNKYQALLTQQNSLQANNEIYRTKLNEMNESMHVLADTAMKVVKMKGMPGKENNFATVYWNRTTKDVYLLQNKLPQTPPDKQYQLWAIVNGKPVNAGLVSDCNGLCKMKVIPNAQAFAITLEQKGGSTAPTMSALYVMGKV